MLVYARLKLKRSGGKLPAIVSLQSLDVHHQYNNFKANHQLMLHGVTLQTHLSTKFYLSNVGRFYQNNGHNYVTIHIHPHAIKSLQRKEAEMKLCPQHMYISIYDHSSLYNNSKSCISGYNIALESNISKLYKGACCTSIKSNYKCNLTNKLQNFNKFSFF